MSASHDVAVDPDALRSRVDDATAVENLSRLRTLGPLLVVVHVLHVVVFLAFRPDQWLDAGNTGRVEVWRLSIAGAHAGAAVFSVLASLRVWRMGSATRAARMASP